MSLVSALIPSGYYCYWHLPVLHKVRYAANQKLGRGVDASNRASEYVPRGVQSILDDGPETLSLTSDSDVLRHCMQI